MYVCVYNIWKKIRLRHTYDVRPQNTSGVLMPLRLTRDNTKPETAKI